MKLKIIIIITIFVQLMNSCKTQKVNFIPNLSIKEINSGFKSKLRFKLLKTEPDKWTWEQMGGGADFEVIAISPDSKNISYFMIGAKIDPKFTEQEVVILYACHMVNKESKSSEIVNWVKKNYNNHMATKIIDNVNITVKAPSSLIRKVEFKAVERN